MPKKQKVKLVNLLINRNPTEAWERFFFLFILYIFLEKYSQCNLVGEVCTIHPHPVCSYLQISGFATPGYFTAGSVC